MIRVVREDVSFRTNLNVNDDIPTVLLINNELIGGWCEDYKIVVDECYLPSLVSDLMNVSIYL